jgi:hypothetical protein
VIAIADAIVAQRSILVAAASSMSRWSAEVPRLRGNGDGDRASLTLPPREDGGVSRTV